MLTHPYEENHGFLRPKKVERVLDETWMVLLHPVYLKAHVAVRFLKPTYVKLISNPRYACIRLWSRGEDIDYLGSDVYCPVGFFL